MGFFAQVHKVVGLIPEGRVMSYGDIAETLGSAKKARYVGFAMRFCPSELPWQRVVKQNGRVVTDVSKRASTDQSVRGIKKMLKENPAKAKKLADEIIRNTYRTLMTRGMKGCFVWCCDPLLNEYLKKQAKARDDLA